MKAVLGRYKIELSLTNLGIIALIGAGIFLAAQIAGVLAMLFIAFIIYAGLRPVVDRLEKFKVPRPVAVVLIYLLVFGVLFVMFVLVANQFILQAFDLVRSLPNIYANVVEFITYNIPLVANILPLQSLQVELSTFVQEFLQSNFIANLVTGQNLLSVVSQTFGVFGSVAGLLISIFTVLMISIYMLQSKEKFYEGLLTLLPESTSKKIEKAISKIEDSLGAWVLGQLSLMVLIGICTYFIVLIPGLIDPNFKLAEYAVPIAIVAGILEAIPNLGPAITTVAAAVLAIGTSGPLSFVYVILAFGMLQNLEAVFFVPHVMRRAVGIHPIVTIIGIISGAQLFGVIGAILIVPLLGVLQIVANEVLVAFRPGSVKASGVESTSKSEVASKTTKSASKKPGK
jgi:predicted PurR-regulated permease PerM